MAIIETILEMRGMRRREIVDYFTGIGGECTERGKFMGMGWEVELDEEVFIAIGSIRIPATKVIFRCGEENSEQIVSAFRLKFLSAGG